MDETKPLRHYFEVFCPGNSVIKARCSTQAEAERAAHLYAGNEGRRYLVYECRIVAEIPAMDNKESVDERVEVACG